jgi:hypothetical protein
LALVFVLSYAWGACAACSPVSQPQTDVHACCKHTKAAHCGESTPSPAKHSTCTHEKRALAAYDRASTDGDAQLVALASLPVLALIAEPIAIAATRHPEAASYSHAPPELLVLNSTFRI